MITRTPAPAYDDLGEIIAFEAVERALDSALREVIRAKACRADWARYPGHRGSRRSRARDVAWLQLRRVYSVAKDH